MRLPSARGPLSGAVLDALRGRPGTDDDRAEECADAVATLVAALGDEDACRGDVDLLTDDDLHLALWVLYALHYRGFDDVDPDLEWDPDLLRARRSLETVFERELRARTRPHVDATLAADGDLPTRLFDLTASFEGPSVARYVHREANHEQFLDLMVQRSIYHLKESDAHSFVIPRLTGRPKAALVELQYDEYGGGRPERVHATLFGDGLEACGLDRRYGAYVDDVPGYTLASDNAMSLLGLHRRLRAAAMGHLGAFEATSSIPCRKYAGGVRRLGLPEEVAAYFDEHVEADAVHEQLAFRDICGTLVADDPAAEEDVVFGATVCLLMDAVAGERMLAAWERGESTLRTGPVRPAGLDRPVTGAVA